MILCLPTRKTPFALILRQDLRGRTLPFNCIQSISRVVPQKNVIQHYLTQIVNLIELDYNASHFHQRVDRGCICAANSQSVCRLQPVDLTICTR
jgi:hypothetical protein